MQRISTRLALSFLLVALLPVVPVVLMTKDLLGRPYNPAYAESMERALESGLTESRGRLQDRQSQLRGHAARIAQGTWESAVLLLDDDGAILGSDDLSRFLADHPNLPSSAPADVGRVGEVLTIGVQDVAGQELLVLQPLPEGMVDRAGALTEGVTLMRAREREGDGIMRFFILLFLGIYVLIILVALAAAFLWSRQMTRPLETLVGATRRVAAGDIDFRLEKQGPGEVGELVESFDRMTGRLGEQRRDLARLERASAWRGMARTLAHEVKNPLTPILMAVHQARDAYQGDDQGYRALLEEVAQIVGEEVESLRRLVREFGDFAQLPKPHPRPGSIGELLRDLEKLYGSAVLDLVPTDLPSSWVFDPDALRRALVNLIDNGMAACREAGRDEAVRLEARPEDSGLTLNIIDRGVGIPEENLSRLFEPDFTTKSGGMGLGLAVVENTILGHGGRISVESIPGEGTTFHIHLPRLEIAPDAEEELS